MFRLKAIAGLSLTLAVLLSACVPSGAAPGGGPVAASAKPVDTTNLVVAVQSLGQDFTPWFASATVEPVVYAVGETLTKVNRKTGVLDGGLAESWSVTPDGRTWTFKLRPNIPFQDGYGTVTADDVKFSWEQAIQPATRLTNAGVYKQAIDSDLKNFEIVGPLEFKLTTTKPLVFLPTVIADYPRGLLIQSRKRWTEKGAAAIQHPHGTGPYKFVSSTTGVDVKLEAVPTHRDAPTYKNVTFKIIPDDAAILAAVTSGTVDLAPIAPRLLGEAKANKLKWISVQDTTNWYLIPGGWYVGDPLYDPKAPWIQADAPEKGLAIRQAISLAIDRKTIVDRVLAGEGAVSRGPYWEYPSNPLSVDTKWPTPEFNLAKAKQLLAQGGYPNGFPVTAPIYDRADKAGMLDINEALAGSFEALGLKVNRLQVDYNGVILPTVRAKKTQGWLYQWGSQPQEPITSLINFATLNTGTPRLVHPLLTESLSKIQAEADRDKRYAMTREMTTKVIEQQILIPLFVTHTPFLASDKVKSWTPIPGLSQISGIETIKP